MNAQIERFRKGFPWLSIVAPATPERGIEVLTEEQQDEAVRYAETAEVNGRCKFVPASGAASRMFKDIFAGIDAPNAATEKLAANLEKFAFYSPEVFGKAPFDPVDTARKLLTDAGLAYGTKPKGVLKFHRYADETRTALAEHFVEGQAYMRNADGSVDLVVTISPEHRPLFEAAVEEIRADYEQRYGVKYNITFTYQANLMAAAFYLWTLVSPRADTRAGRPNRRHRRPSRSRRHQPRCPMPQPRPSCPTRRDRAS